MQFDLPAHDMVRQVMSWEAMVGRIAKNVSRLLRRMRSSNAAFRAQPDNGIRQQVTMPQAIELPPPMVRQGLRNNRLEDFVAPQSLEQLTLLLRTAPETCAFIAGGQNIVPALRAGMVNASLLIDLGQVAELRGIAREGNTLQIGAMTKLVELQRDDLTKGWSLLHHALSYVGSHTIRNRATVGGNLAWGDPRAELPLALMLYQACIKTDKRVVPIESFVFSGSRSNLDPREFIERVEVPFVEAERPGGFVEMLDRHSIGKSIISAGFLWMGRGTARVGIGGLVDKPLVATVAVGEIDEWVDRLEREFPKLADPFHSFEYRRSMAKVALRRLSREFSK